MANIFLKSKPAATYQDVIDLPEYLVAEIIDGVLYTHIVPAPIYSLAGSGLMHSIYRPFMKGEGGPGGWWLFRGIEIHFGEDVIVPNFSGWRRERFPTFPIVDYFTSAPDWAC